MINYLRANMCRLKGSSLTAEFCVCRYISYAHVASYGCRCIFFALELFMVVTRRGGVIKIRRNDPGVNSPKILGSFRRDLVLETKLRSKHM